MKRFVKFFQNILPKRIWQQVFALLVFLVVIPLFLLGALLIHSSQRMIKASILNDYREVAIHATGEVRENIKSVHQALVVTASILGTLDADPWRQETSIVELALRYPVFQSISSVDRKGKEIVTSQLGVELKDRSGDEAFQQAIKGESYVSQVAMGEDYLPVLTMAVPIRYLGKIKGVLLAQVNIRSIWDIVDSIQFGETGRAHIVDEQGRVIAHPDKKMVLQDIKSPYPAVVSDVLKGTVGSKEVIDHNSQSWLVSYAPVTPLGWGLVIAQSQKEAFAFSRIMYHQAWLLIIVSILATIVMSFVLARFLSQPMNDILGRTKRLVKGDYTQSFRIRRRDEIGHLLFSFNRMTQKLRDAQQTEKLSLIGKAATAIAHELKNSLSLVKGFVQILPRRIKDEQFINEFSDVIPKELESWNGMLRNMMDFSRRAEFLLEEMDLNELILKEATLVKLRLKQKNINFKLKLQKDLPLIMGNEEKLKQVLLNIITNAIEATASGGEILLETKHVFSLALDAKDKNRIAVKVSNMGGPIDKECLDKIFTPFFSTKKHGLGLGLSISREILQAHSGSIEVIEERVGWTTFYIQIPASSIYPIRKVRASASAAKFTIQS